MNTTTAQTKTTDPGVKLPKIAYFFMRHVLKLRKNPKKYRNILEQAGVKEGMTILDYGCGIGSYTIEAAKLIGTTGEVVAADLNESMLREVRKSMLADKLSNICPTRINAPEDVQESNFDMILLIDVLHLMKEPLKIIETMLKKLSGQGKLLIKLEHFGKQQSDLLLAEIPCSDKKAVADKYWVVSR